MLSRQIIKKALKFNSAMNISKRFGHDVSFPVNSDKVYYQEPYEAFVGTKGILWQPTPEKVSKTEARANFKASMLEKKADADKLYAELDDADKALFDKFFKDVLDVKKPVESGVFKPFGPRYKPLTLFHTGGYTGLLRNSLRTKKHKLLMFLSAFFMISSFLYIVALALLTIRAYFDGILYPHH